MLRPFFSRNRGGDVETFKMGCVSCRALVARDDGEILSTLDCWRMSANHPMLQSQSEKIVVTRDNKSYLVNVQDIAINNGIPETDKRFEMKFQN